MATTEQIKITGIVKPCQKRRDGFRVVVKAEKFGGERNMHLDAPSRHKLRKRLEERGATEEMIREAGL